MTKTEPQLKRGEIPVKVNVTVEDSAFKSPTLVREIRVADPWEGIDLTDVTLKVPVITEEEAEVIKARRIEQMITMLTERGYTVEAGCTHGDDCLVHPGGLDCGRAS